MAALQRFYSLECGGISVLRDGRWEDGRNGWVAGLGGFVGGVGIWMVGGGERYWEEERRDVAIRRGEKGCGEGRWWDEEEGGGFWGGGYGDGYEGD